MLLNLRFALALMAFFSSRTVSSFSVGYASALFSEKSSAVGSLGDTWRPCHPLRCKRERVLVRAETSEDQQQNLKQEAERLRERAKELRASIPEEKLQDSQEVTSSIPSLVSPWTVEATETPGVGYRLYVDIGREPGTWMDPRWGASGKRIEFTMDVRFLTDGDESIPDKAVEQGMVKDNFGGKSSPVRVLQSAEMARLRSGFDRMKTFGGGYRIDVGKNAATVRFYVQVDGTAEAGSSYGDISIPKGGLYFSLPCFGNNVSNLSTKEGPVTVRQIGWNTGWRREESRIVGIFRAVPIEAARKRDGF